MDKSKLRPKFVHMEVTRLSGKKMVIGYPLQADGTPRAWIDYDEAGERKLGGKVVTGPNGEKVVDAGLPERRVTRFRLTKFDLNAPGGPSAYYQEEEIGEEVGEGNHAV